MEPVPEDLFNPKQEAEVMMSFMELPSEVGVSNFVLEGPELFDVPTEFNVFVGLFSPMQKSGSPRIVILRTDEGDKKMMMWHRKILDLSVPKRVKKLEIQSNPRLRNQLEEVMNSIGLPYAVIAFGNQRDGGAEVVLMKTVWGLLPQEALTEFQNKSKERLRSLN